MLAWSTTQTTKPNTSTSNTIATGCQPWSLFLAVVPPVPGGSLQCWGSSSDDTVSSNMGAPLCAALHVRYRPRANARHHDAGVLVVLWCLRTCLHASRRGADDAATSSWNSFPYGPHDGKVLGGDALTIDRPAVNGINARNRTPRDRCGQPGPDRGGLGLPAAAAGRLRRRSRPAGRAAYPEEIFTGRFQTSVGSDRPSSWRRSTGQNPQLNSRGTAT
jgi:hypothetical protein